MVGAIQAKVRILPWCWWWVGWYWTTTLKLGGVGEISGKSAEYAGT